jgi:hypothetical protein
VHCEYQLLLAGVTESVVVAVFEGVIPCITCVENEISVAVVICNFCGIGDAIAVAIGDGESDGVVLAPRDA